jgi:hypothetical protein
MLPKRGSWARSWGPRMVRNGGWNRESSNGAASERRRETPPVEAGRNVSATEPSACRAHESIEPVGTGDERSEQPVWYEGRRATGLARHTAAWTGLGIELRWSATVIFRAGGHGPSERACRRCDHGRPWLAAGAPPLAPTRIALGQSGGRLSRPPRPCVVSVDLGGPMPDLPPPCRGLAPDRQICPHPGACSRQIARPSRPRRQMARTSHASAHPPQPGHDLTG